MSTAISWTDETWNPVSGCSRVSDGCRFCYAERLSLRFGWSTKPWMAAGPCAEMRLPSVLATTAETTRSRVTAAR